MFPILSSRVELDPRSADLYFACDPDAEVFKVEPHSPFAEARVFDALEEIHGLRVPRWLPVDWDGPAEFEPYGEAGDWVASGSVFFRGVLFLVRFECPLD